MLVIIGFSLHLLSCSQPGVGINELVLAKNLMQEYPDSALLVLESIRSPEKMDNANYAAYCLLLTEAQDKNYYAFTSDSVIRVAADYFEATGNKLKLPKTYYYMGRVHHDLKDIPYALEYYLKAEQTAGDNFGDTRLMSRIYNSIGRIYTMLHIYEEAIEANKQAEYYLETCGDSIGLPFVLRDIARIYHVTEKRDSAILYYKQAILNSRRVDNKYAFTSSLTEIAGLYVEIKDYDKANDCLAEVLEFAPHESVSDQFALTAGDFYQNTGKVDSALYYFTQSTQSKSIYTRAASYYKLYQMAKNELNYKQALIYSDTYNLYKDSISQLKEREESLRIQNLYNLQKLTVEKELLEKQHAKKQHFITLLSTILLFSILLAVITILYQRKRSKNELFLKEKQLRLKEEQYKKSQRHIDENKSRIESLKNKLRENTELLDQTEKALMEKQVKLLQHENNRITLFNESKALQFEKLVSSPIYNKLKNATFGKLTEKNIWDDLKSTTDKIYGCIATKLRIYCPKISERELQICYLINAHFNITEIADLTGCTKSAISKSRKRLYEKIHDSTGSGGDLDQFITNL